MRGRIRLGPAAVLLVIVAMVVGTLSMLTISTSNADLVMTEKFADVTNTRYDLIADGELFLCEAAEAGTNGTDPGEMKGVTPTEEGYRYEKEKNGYKLEVAISWPDWQGNYELKQFRISRNWQAADPAQDIWKGN